MSNISPEEYVECPYNPVHRMLRKRLQQHLIRCRKSYPDVELKKCPFNATHLIPEPEYTHHISNCPGKALIMNYKYHSAPMKEEDGPKKHDPIESEENWDDTEVEDYDPQKYASQAKVIRSHNSELPSVMKEFRRQERKRLGDYDSDDDEEDKKSIFTNQGKKICKNETPTPPAPPAWPGGVGAANEPLWFEDTRRATEIEDQPLHEHYLDDDPYYSRGISSHVNSRLGRGRGRRTESDVRPKRH